MKTHGRIDNNHREIVDTFLQLGASVTSLASLGQGVPDLLVGVRGQTALVEVKNGAKPPSKRRLTADQQDWHCTWRGAPVQTVTSPDDAIALVRLLDGRNRA